MTNVVSPFKLNPERIKELRDAGVEIEANLEEANLPEPQYGETVVGTLTAEEAQLFMAYYDAKNKFDDLQRNLTAEIFLRAGNQIKTSDRSKTLAQQFSAEDFKNFASDEEEREFCRMDMLVAALKTNFFFTIAERLGKHEFVLGVRSKSRIVQSIRRLENAVQMQ